jgi:hypothetical protein
MTSEKTNHRSILLRFGVLLLLLPAGADAQQRTPSQLYAGFIAAYESLPRDCRQGEALQYIEARVNLFAYLQVAGDLPDEFRTQTNAALHYLEGVTRDIGYCVGNSSAGSRGGGGEYVIPPPDVPRAGVAARAGVTGGRWDAWNVGFVNAPGGTSGCIQLALTRMRSAGLQNVREDSPGITVRGEAPGILAIGHCDVSRPGLLHVTVTGTDRSNVNRVYFVLKPRGSG